MPSVLSDDDKETVRRMVPKASNKIQAVAVARLYIAYPNPSKWTYTGLQGAVVLCNDLIGNTYWLKLVDISVSKPVPTPLLLSRKIFSELVLIPSSLATVESYGTRRSMINGTIIRTARSAIHLRWSNAWRGYRSPTKRRQRHF
jgi:hypothetical protein